MNFKSQHAFLITCSTFWLWLPSTPLVETSLHSLCLYLLCIFRKKIFKFGYQSVTFQNYAVSGSLPVSLTWLIIGRHMIGDLKLLFFFFFLICSILKTSWQFDIHCYLCSGFLAYLVKQLVPWFHILARIRITWRDYSLKYRLLGLARISDSVALEWCLRMGIVFPKFPSAADAAVWGPCSRNHGAHLTFFSLFGIMPSQWLKKNARKIPTLKCVIRKFVLKSFVGKLGPIFFFLSQRKHYINCLAHRTHLNTFAKKSRRKK